MFSLICRITGISLTILLLIIIIVKIVKFLWISFIAKDFQWFKTDSNQQIWALITGSTDGIGLCYAKEMAKLGYNLILISRNEFKLNKTKEEIKEKHINCEIITIALDFTRIDIYEEIERKLKNLDEIHVLINNVGTAYPNSCPEFFTQIPETMNFINCSINVNIFSCIRLINMILPKMEVKGRGVIINISSFTALFPIPLLSLYSATKVFIDHFSQSLHYEYKDKGIIIQSVLPFYVSTNMTKNISTNFMIPSPQKFTESALKTIGIEKRTFGFITHKIFGKFTQLVGNYLKMRFAFNHFKEIRRRFYANENLNKININLFIPSFKM